MSLTRKDWKPKAAFQVNSPIQQPQQPQQEQGGRGGWLTSLISEIGGMGGAGVGAAIGSSVLPGLGTLLGAGLGGFLGGTGGSLAENKVRDGEVRIGDSLKEGALEGVFAAGPIRLGKAGFSTAKGLAKGGSLVDELVKAGTKVAAPGVVASKTAKGLANASDDLVTKQFRFTPSQITKFKSKFGEDIATTIKRYGVKSADDVAKKVVDPLNQQFDDIVRVLPGVKKETVQKAFMKRYKPLLDSAVNDSKNIGKALKAQSDEILKKYGDVIESEDLLSLRREFDDLVRYTDRAVNPATYGVNKRAADSVREALQTAAKSQGLPLKEVGKELNKAIQLEEYIARQSNLGRGSLPIGLSTLLGGTAGGAAFGAPGLATAAGVGLVNSNTGRRVISGAAQGAANRAGKSGLKTSSIIGRQAGGNLAQALLGAQSPENSMSSPSPMPNPSATNQTINDSPSLGTLNTTSPQESTPNSLAEALADPGIQQQLLLADLLDPNSQGSNVGILEAIFEISTPDQQGLDLNSTAIARISDYESGLQALDDLEQAFDSSNVNNPVVGDLRRLNPFDTSAQDLNSITRSVRQLVGRALEGGVLRREDEIKYEQMLPKVGDTDEAAKAKLNNVRRLLQTNLNAYMQNQQLYGGGQTSGDDLASVMAAQGAQSWEQ